MALLHRFGNPRGRTILVEARTLQGLLIEIDVKHGDFQKFDVEGGEEQLFNNAFALSCISAVVGEVYDDLLKDSEADFLPRFARFRVVKSAESADLFVVSAAREG